MNKYWNRRCLFIFTLTFLCLFILSGAALTSNYIIRIERERETYEESCNRESRQVLSYMEQQFDSAIKSANAIFSSTWFNHYRNVAGVYDEEFNKLKKLEIQNDIASRVVIMPMVNDMLIITPSKNTIIGKNGWMSAELYNKVYGDVAVIEPGGFRQYPKVACTNDALAIFTVNDNTERYDKSVICVMLNRATVRSRLSEIMPGDIVYLNMVMNDASVCSIGDGSADANNITLNIDMPKVEIEMRFLSFNEAHGMNTMREYVLSLLLMVVACIILAALVAAISNKPISEMILSFGGKARDLDNPYQFIYEYVDAYSKHTDYLKMRVDDLGEARTRFLELMQNEIFLGMLINPKFNFSDEYITTFLPWINDGKPCLMLAVEPMRDGVKLDLDSEKISPSAAHVAHMDIFNAHCMLIWYSNIQEAIGEREAIIERLNGRARALAAISEAIIEPEEFHNIYGQLRAELTAQRRMREDLPVSDQMALSDCIRRHDALSCMNVAMPYIARDCMEPIMIFVQRDALETGINIRRFENEFYEASDVHMRETALKKSIEALAGASECEQVVEQHDDIAEQIVAYIRENFCDPELCVMQLADKFDMHRSLISKAVKANTGATFSELIQMLRLSKAIELMTGNVTSLNDVAQMVGYANYLSFKRAFIRVYNISPREYRNHAMNSENITK